jgi:hypothetical protein
VAFALLGRVPQAREDPVALLALLLNAFDVWSGEQLAKLGELDEATFVKKGVDVLRSDEDARRELAALLAARAGVFLAAAA